MKRLFLIVVVLITNGLYMSSCTYNDTAENDALYDTHATEGEDGHIMPPEEPE